MRVCTTIDNGFNMLVDGVTRITSVTSDQQLRGFDVDVRAAVLTGALNLSYSLRVLPSYGELQVATRKDECDVGWAPFFILGERERCSANVNTCRSLESLSTELKSFASGTINWTPWRCCIDYTPAHLNCASARSSRPISATIQHPDVLREWVSPPCRAFRTLVSRTRWHGDRVQCEACELL